MFEQNFIEPSATLHDLWC